MGEKFKKNRGNQIAKKGEEYVEVVLKTHTYHRQAGGPEPRDQI